MIEIVDIETLPCGCTLTRQLNNGIKEFQIAACKQSCQNLKNTLELANEKNLPIEYRSK